MLFCKQVEEKIGQTNRMTWILLTEINRMYDKVFLFAHNYTMTEQFQNFSEWDRAKKYIVNKLNNE